MSVSSTTVPIRFGDVRIRHGTEEKKNLPSDQGGIFHSIQFKHAVHPSLNNKMTD
jgi:hypothetical protein